MVPFRPGTLFLARVTLIKPLQSLETVLVWQTFNLEAWLLELTGGTFSILLFPGIIHVILKCTKERQWSVFAVLMNARRAAVLVQRRS